MRFFGRSVVLLSLVGISLFLGTPALAQTPTPATTIEDGGGVTVFQSFVDGALLAPGTFGTGTIPATGGGTRLMWYPKEAAFRAGQVGDGTDGLEWNDTNVGNYSVAFGRNTIASGTYSVAMGDASAAEATSAIALGGATFANGTGATALGLGTEATAQGATAMGDGTTASAQGATAMGEGTQATALRATAMGEGTQATAPNATAMGDGAIASVFASTAMGFRTEANASASTAMGEGTVTKTVNSLSIGECNDANNVSATGSTLLAVGNGSYDQNTDSCISTSDALVLDDNGNLSIGGVFESGPTSSTYAGHFRGSKNQTDGSGPDSHIALVENTNTGSSASGLAIQTGANTSPVGGNNYLTFYDGDGDPVGSVEGTGSGGVNYSSGTGDFAEELPVAQGASIPDAADLVGVRGKTVRLRTDDADRVMIVSRAPLMTGNTTPATKADDDRRVPVAFIGQVPVRLRGDADVGDLIVASGRNDGTARAVAPENYRRAEHGPIAGEAWAEKTTDGIGTVTVAVGLNHSGAVAQQMQEQRARIEQLEAENASIKKRLAALEAQSSGSVAAGWTGPWGLITALSFLVGGLSGALLWREQA